MLASHLRTKVKERSRWRHFRYLRSAFSAFVAASDGKYPKAAERLQKDRDALLAFHDLPAPQWQHIRTTNPTESTFATVRLRTAKTRGCFSRQSILSSVYRLGLSAEKRWRRLRGLKHLADVIDGVKFIGSVRAKKTENSRADA